MSSRRLPQQPGDLCDAVRHLLVACHHQHLGPIRRVDRHAQHVREGEAEEKDEDGLPGEAFRQQPPHADSTLGVNT